LDFEGAEEETFALATNFGVVGVDCEAMAKDVRKLRMVEVEEGEWALEEEEVEAFRFKMTVLSTILSKL
jgi:hypothetical protein